MRTEKLFGMAVVVCGLAFTAVSCSNEDNPIHVNPTPQEPTTRQVTVSFENQALNADGFWIGSENEQGADNGYGGKTYPNVYVEEPLAVNTTFGVTYWSGFAISNRTATEFAPANITPDQYNNVTGKAHTGANFLVAQYSYSGEKIAVNGAKGGKVLGLWYTNSTYPVNSILNGDSYSGPAFEAADWLKCTVTGKKADGTTATVDIDLAKNGDYVKEWKYADLSALGKVVELSFTFSGSRMGDYGLNTPAYICIDDITVEVEK